MPIPTTAAIARPGADTFSWEPVLLDEPGPDEVLIRLVATGLCHTDLSVLAGRLPTLLPAILGHEGAGIVEAVGPGTQHLQPGDRAVLSFNSCGRCARCRIGQPTRCDTYFPRNFGATRPDGSSPARTADGTPVGALFNGAKWDQIPERFGPAKTCYDRFARWEQDGTWARIEKQLQADADAIGDLDWCAQADSTVVRAHQHAAGARKRG